MMKDTPNHYGKLSKIIHWLVALFIISLLAVGFYMETMPNSTTKWFIYALHKSFGLTVLALMLFRYGWRLANINPALPQNIPKWQKIAAHITHGILYLLGVIMPMSGWVMSVASDHTPKWFGLFVASLPISRSKVIAMNAHHIHSFVAWLLIGFIALHISAAFWHGLGKEGVLWRMLWTKKQNSV